MRFWPTRDWGLEGLGSKGSCNLLFRAGLAVYVYVWATRLYDFCLIAAADAAKQQALLVTHTVNGGKWRNGVCRGLGRETALAFKWKIEFIT